MTQHAAPRLLKCVSLSLSELGLIAILILATIGMGIYVHTTLTRVHRGLPAEILRQAGELTLLIQDLARLAQAAELAVLQPTPSRRQMIIKKNNVLQEHLKTIRDSFVFDNLVGAAALHALVHPASADIGRWLDEGLPGLAPDSPIVLQLVETRAREVYDRARDLSLQGSTTALTLLDQETVRLEQFRYGVLGLLACLGLLSLLVIALFLRQRYAESRVAVLREQLADAIESIPEGFVLCDADDRIVVSNVQFRRMYPSIRHLATTGMPFAELLRVFVNANLIVDSEGREDELFAERLERHRNPSTPFEHELRDGRRIRISERRTRNGGTVGIHADMTDVRRIQERLRHMATHDSLTGLPNRAYCEERLMQALSWAQRQESCFAVLYLDLDRFKAINDTLGHHAGDEVLQAVAKRLKHHLREQDMLARLGGDEFMVILEEITDSAAATATAQRLLAALAQPLLISAGEVHVYTSIGVACFPDNGRDIETLRRNADAACYHAKSCGPNRYSLYQPRFADNTDNTKAANG